MEARRGHTARSVCSSVLLSAALSTALLPPSFCSRVRSLCFLSVPAPVTLLPTLLHFTPLSSLSLYCTVRSPSSAPPPSVPDGPSKPSVVKLTLRRTRLALFSHAVWYSAKNAVKVMSWSAAKALCCRDLQLSRFMLWCLRRDHPSMVPKRDFYSNAAKEAAAGQSSSCDDCPITRHRWLNPIKAPLRRTQIPHLFTHVALNEITE